MKTIRGMYPAVCSSGSEHKRLDQRLAFLNAMLTDIESFVPSDFGSLEGARDVLVRAGRDDSMTEEAVWKRSPKRIADEERKLFQEHLGYLVTAPDWIKTVEQLPYRRVLGEPESKRLWERLKERWQVDGGYWYPEELINVVPPLVVVFDANAFEAAVPPDILGGILAEHGIHRVFTLFEFQGENEYEIDLALLEPWYSSSGELYCTSNSMDWLLYASHENAIALAGEWLIEAIKATWSDWPQHPWQMITLEQPLPPN